MGIPVSRKMLCLFTPKRSFGARALTLAVAASIVLGVTSIPAQALTASQFELDGNPTKAVHDDWNNVLSGSGSDISHVFIADGQSGDTTYFNKGGSKDIHPISSWLSGGPGAPDKDEILNAYAAAYADGTIYFGADRYANNGDSVIGFWFFQNKIGLSGVNFTGTHKVGDVLVVADFPGGVGTIGDIKVYKWNGSGITDVTPATGADCSTAIADPVCAITNQGPETAPWAYAPKKGPSGTFPAGSFFEGGIDLSHFFDTVPCFSSFMAETRTSHSVNARLKDFALGDINNCGKVAPGLSILKTADDPSVSAGTDIGFKIKVSNAGPGPATDVTVTDPLPSGSGISWTVADDGGATCNISSGTLTCTKATLASGGSFTVHVTSHTDKTSCGTYENTATVSAENDGSPQSSASTTVVCARIEIEIEKKADAQTVSAGETIGFKITVTNDGQGTATGVSMTDTLPTDPGLTWTVADDGGASCSIDTGTLTCTKASLGSGDLFTVHITSPTTDDTCGTVTNTASVSLGEQEIVSAQQVRPIDSSTASVDVLCPDISITKTPDHTTVKGGDPIGFTITVSNSDDEGTGTAHDVTLTDPLPGGFTWHMDPVNGDCKITTNTLTCDFDDLGPGDSVSVHVVSSPTTAEDCGSNVDNTATVTLDNGEGGDASASVDVICPELSINIDKDGPEVTHVGDTIHYTLTVTNGTQEPLHNITVTDPVCDSPPVYQSGDTNADNILQSSESWIYTCDHLVTESDPDPLPNTATVTGTDKLGRETSAEDSHSVDILHPSISIVKTVNPTSGKPGDTVTYTFVVKNTSSDTTLLNVTVTDDKLGLIGTIASLAPGQSVTLTKTTTLPNSGGDLVNVGTATGTDVGGKTVKDTDNATVTVVLAVPPLVKTGTNDSGLGLVGFLFIAVGVAMATRKERGRVRPAFAPSSSAAGRGVMFAAHRRSWRMRRRRGPPTRARLRWRRSQGPPTRDGP